MDKKVKFAFTLFELLVAFSIIVFIVTFTTHTILDKLNNYGAMYYNAYNTLRKVSYNIFIDTYCPNPVRRNSDPEPGEPGYNEEYDCILGPRAFPKDTAELCKRYVEYLNIADEKYVYCESGVNINDKADNINENALRFTTSNSFKFYLGGKSYESGDKNNKPYKYNMPLTDADGNPVLDENNNQVTKEIEYFIVYVDLNGSKTPNKVKKEEGVNLFLPDIVPFAVTRRGEIIPMGLPIFRMEYLTARIRYPDLAVVDGNGNTTGYQEDMSETFNFYNAVKYAWGKKDNNNNIDIVLDSDIPFTFIDFLNTNQLPNDSKIYYNLETNPNINPAQTPDPNHDRTDSCHFKSYDCRVIIDSSTVVRMYRL